jgi:predicted DNA-binding transcriptional regulator AlpA
MTLKDLIEEREYAEMRGVSVRTIQRERSLRIGPPFIKLGRTIYYRPEAIDAWLHAKEQTQVRGAV